MTEQNNGKEKLIRYSYIQGWLSVVLNTLLFILKYWAGLATGSVAIIADAWHTLSDSLTSVVLMVATKISSKPADKEHPFGHGRAEIISSVIIGLFLGFVAFNFTVESIKKLQNFEHTTYGTFAIVATIISILAKELLAQFAFWAGRKVSSQALKADGWHHRSDAISSVIILFGIFFGKDFWWIDGVLGLIVSVIIFYATYQILREAFDILMGKEPDEYLVKNIERICRSVIDTDIFLHHIHVHNYGHHKEVTFHIKLQGSLLLKEAHSIATNIEREIRKELNIEATIHMEPIKKQKFK